MFLASAAALAVPIVLTRFWRYGHDRKKNGQPRQFQKQRELAAADQLSTTRPHTLTDAISTLSSLFLPPLSPPPLKKRIYSEAYLKA